MFLSFLNQKERENYLELANYVAKSDSNVDDSEVNWIEKVKKEIDLENYEIQEKPFDDIMNELDSASFISKTSILLDIMNLVMADFDYKHEEQKVIKKIREKWNIDDEQYNSILFWLKDKAYILKVEEQRKL